MTTHHLRLHQCTVCSTEAKLPYRGDCTSWCDQCKANTFHVMRAEHTVSESIENRMKRFLETASSRFRKDDEPEQPPTAEETGKKLHGAGYPFRHIAHVGKMRGPGVAAAEKLITSRRRDWNACLWGGNGTGKTQIAVRVAWARFEAGKPVGRYVTLPDLLTAMKSGIARDIPQDDILRPYRTSGFLVIDECQDAGATERSVEWIRETLRQIADVRYREFRPTLWICNANEPEAISNHLGQRIVDRINETGGLIHCNWPSYRKD